MRVSTQIFILLFIHLYAFIHNIIIIIIINTPYVSLYVHFIYEKIKKKM